jgi:hypothetical protein
MPNGRPRSNRSRHANNRRNTRRDQVVGTESNPIIACPVYPDIEGTPPTSPVAVVTQTDQVAGLNEQVRDLTQLNENLIKEFQKTKKKLEKATKEGQLYKGNYQYMKNALCHLGDELDELGYGKLQGLEINLDSNYQPKKNIYGEYSHPFHLNFATKGKDCQDTDKMNAIWEDGYVDKDGLNMMSIRTAKKRAKEMGVDVEIMTLDDLQSEVNRLQDVIETKNKKLDRLAELGLKASIRAQQLEDEFNETGRTLPDLLNQVAVESQESGKNITMEMPKKKTVEMSCQTDDMCLYDTDMKGWCGY